MSGPRGGTNDRDPPICVTQKHSPKTWGKKGQHADRAARPGQRPKTEDRGRDKNTPAGGGAGDTVRGRRTAHTPNKQPTFRNHKVIGFGEGAAAGQGVKLGFGSAQLCGRESGK